MNNKSKAQRRVASSGKIFIPGSMEIFSLPKKIALRSGIHGHGKNKNIYLLIKQ
jgi:hypothetical protein